MTMTLRLLPFLILLLPAWLGAINPLPGDIYSHAQRINLDTFQVDEMIIWNPTAVLVVGDDYLIRSTQSQLGRLWRYTPATGEWQLLAEGNEYGSFGAPNTLAGVLNDEVYFLTGWISGATHRLTAHNLVTGESREMPIPQGAAFGAGLEIAANGNLIAVAATGGGAVVYNSQGELLANPGGLELRTLKTLARAPDGRVLGACAFDTFPQSGVSIVEIDPETGELTVLQEFEELGFSGSYMWMGVAPDGAYHVGSTASGDFAHYRISGDSYEILPITLPENIEFHVLSMVTVDTDGSLLAVVKDRRLYATENRVILRIDPETGESEIALGDYNVVDIHSGYRTVGADEAIYFVPKSDARGEVNRLDLKTGGVTNVTDSGEHLSAARQIAAVGSDLYVINQSVDQNSHLVKVDSQTGAQTYLSDLGNRLFIREMLYDPGSGDLLFTSLAGHPLGGYGTVMRVSPEAGATPEAITQTPFTGNPAGFELAPDGDLYVLLTAGSGPRQVVHVDRETGAWTLIVETVEILGSDVALLGDGNLVAVDATSTSLMKIDVATGEISTLISGGLRGTDFFTRLPPGAAPSGDTFSAATGAEAYADGWYFLSWYGWFNEAGPWILHLEHGWQYFGGGGGASLYLYDALLGSWIWVSPQLFPEMYAFSPHDDWLRYSPGGLPANRWFYSGNGGQWINVTGP